MARISGKIGQVKLDATTPSVVYGVTSWEMTYEGNAIDVTGMNDNGAKTFIPGLTSATITVEAFEESDHPLNTDVRPGNIVLFDLYYQSTDSNYWYGSAIVTSASPSVQVDGAVKWTINLQATGTVSYGVRS